MLLWSPSALFNSAQSNYLRNCDKLFWRLCGLVLLSHVFIIIGYGIFSRRQPLVVHVTRTNLRSNQAIKVLPFVRRTGQLERVFKRPAVSRRARAQQALVGEKKVQVTKKISRHVKFQKSSKNKLVVKKVLQKSEKKSKKKIKKIKPEKKSKKVPEPVIEKPVVAEQPKIEPKKRAVAASRVAEREPKEPVSSEPVVTAPEGQEVSASVTSPVTSSPSPEAAPETVALSATTPEELNVDLAAAIDPDQSPIELGQEEFDALQTYRAIHDELSKNWHPPARLQPKQSCVILVSLDEHGAVKDLHIEQPSGILAYDIAARMAVNSSIFPETIWGQHIRLHF